MHQSFVTRFAPSPTGLLHLGHAYAALMAGQLGDRFLLRFEDIDRTRVRPEFYTAIEEDLAWLGLQWEEVPVRQLDRLPLYQEALEVLEEKGLVYPCFCTRRDLQSIDAPQGPEGPLYPGTCRGLAAVDLSQPHCWRLNATKAAELAGSLTFEDEIHGRIAVQPELLGDVILARKDIETSYHIAVVVDDAAQGISLVTRGEDLLPSTHIHRLLHQILGLPVPLYHHHRLIRDEAGRRLAKRDSARSLKSLRDSGESAASLRERLGFP